MKSKKIVLVALSAILIAGFSAPSAQALTNTELQQLIINLQAQIAQLQAQLNQQQDTPVAWCHDFNTNLKIGDEGKEVEALQSALTKDGSKVFDYKGWDGVFDEMTAGEVVSFQLKYKNEILTPSGLKNGTGYVGKATRAKLNQLYGCNVVQPPTTTTPSITSVFPASGASNDTITIYGKNLVDTIPSGITIELLKNGLQKGTIAQQHISVQPNGLSLKFQLPGLVVENIEYGTYQIRILNDNGKSNAVNFTTVALSAPSITVLSPNGGETWKFGVPQTIKWIAKNIANSQNVSVQIINSSTQMAYELDTKNANDGIAIITIPASVPLGSYRARIITQDQAQYQDQSDNYFSIVAATTTPSITVLSPNGGERWQIRQTYTITWKSSGIDKVNINVASGNNSWYLAYDIPAPLGQYSWKADKSEGTTYRVNVLDTKSSVSDYSDNYFSIVAAATTTPPVVFCDNYGDVNEDGTVDMTDSLFIAQYINGSKTFTAEQKLRADVNQDGSITNADSTQIAEYRVGTRTTFTACSKTPACGSYGDVNGNGYVNQRDALLIAEYRVGNAVLTDAQKTKADVDGDGSVTMTDSLKISQYVRGILIAFPVCILGSVETGLNNVASLIESLRKVLGR